MWYLTTGLHRAYAHNYQREETWLPSGLHVLTASHSTSPQSFPQLQKVVLVPHVQTFPASMDMNSEAITDSHVMQGW